MSFLAMEPLFCQRDEEDSYGESMCDVWQVDFLECHVVTRHVGVN